MRALVGVQPTFTHTTVTYTTNKELIFNIKIKFIQRRNFPLSKQKEMSPISIRNHNPEISENI